MKANEVLTVFPTDNGNATIVLDSDNCNRKIAAPLEDQTYRKLKDPTDCVECKTILLLMKSSIFLPSKNFGPRVPGP